MAHIEVPPTWEITNYKKGAHRTIEALMPRDPNTNEPFNDQPILEIRFRGIPVGRENVPKFKEIMEADLHTLNHNDMNWVERMLNRQTVEVLHLSLARTCEVHGRRVLELSGHYDIYPYKKLPCMLWYIDVDFSYSYLQKFIYHGCVEDDNFKQCEENFLKHKGEAAQIFKSIEWSSWAPPPPLK